MKHAFEIAEICEQHDLADFDSGRPALDDWLKNNALRANSQGSAHTVVLTRIGQNKVVGYYAVAPTSIERSRLPSRAAGGISVVPGYIVAKLALDRSVHGRGLGANMLSAALTDIVAASKSASGRVVVVDAIDDDALAFYEYHGFLRIGDTMRLYRLISQVAAEVERFGNQ